MLGVLKLACANLVRGRARNLFTLFGIAISIALFVSLTSISTAMKMQLDQSVTLCKADIILQEKGAATPMASRLADDVAQKLENMSEIKSVSSLTVGSVKISGKSASLPYLFLFGVSSLHPYLSVAEWIGTGIVDGRMFRSGEHEILLGRLAAKRLQVEIGSTVNIGNNQTYTVSGIYWLGQGILDGGAIVELGCSQSLLRREGNVNMVLAEVRGDKRNLVQLISRIQEYLPDVSVIPGSSMRSQIRAVTMIDSFINAVSSAALFLGGLLILNTLLMAVSERTREIGVLMAVGWSRRMIMTLLISEALMISAVGGILGYGLAFPALKFLTMLPSIGPGWVTPMPAPELFIRAISLAVVIGGISSLYPAFRAIRMTPAVALRYEC
ncbi:ABC transporter permease [bacterium]|nr:ABC transporter permease [bacterium]